MKKVMDAMLSGYLNDQFEEIMPKYSITKTENEFNELWESMIKDLPDEVSKKYSDLRVDSDYENVKREFTNAFRLGFILCAEVFLGE
ncbi:hypothetical protein [Porcipelethomonas sp.]|uniref:hypothetical protein n=1 Tax=Porcipelethomonas sp. TaxID=2981675 RepID=UPI003EF85A89